MDEQKQPSNDKPGSIDSKNQVQIAKKDDVIDQIKKAPQDEQIAYICIFLGILLILIGLVSFLVL